MRRLAGLLALLLSLGAPPLAGTAKEVCGSLQSLDVENGTITVAVGGEEGPKTFSLIKRDMSVTDPLGTALKLEGLHQKHRVALTLDDNKDYVVGIRLESDCRWGLFQGAGKDGAEITVRFSYFPQKIPLRQDVRVLIEGKPAQLRDLKAEHPVRLTYAPDHRRLLLIESARGAITVNPYCRISQYNGVLLKIDRDRRKIEVVDLAERPRPEEFSYDAWTPVRLVYSSRPLRQTTMDSLWPYAKVVINYETDLRRASVVSAEVQKLLRRPVAKLDLQSRKLSLKVHQDQVEEFTIPPDVKVIHGEPAVAATLDQVREGRIVSVGLGPDGREVLLIHVWDK